MQLENLCNEAAALARSWAREADLLVRYGLQTSVILTGSLKDGRAWCRVLGFAEEFSISVSVEPIALGECRRGWPHPGGPHKLLLWGAVQSLDRW